MKALISSHKIIDSACFLGEHDPTKTELTSSLEYAFRNSDVTLVYYTGHGRQYDGAWCLLDTSMPGYVGPQEVFSWWNEHKRDEDSYLVIISDSCYSGHWCDYALTSCFENVAVYAASSSSEFAYDTENGGKYTLQLLQDQQQQQANMGPLPIKVTPIGNRYDDEKYIEECQRKEAEKKDSQERVCYYVITAFNMYLLCILQLLRLFGFNTGRVALN